MKFNDISVIRKISKTTRKMSKTKKVGVIAGVAGAVIVAVPFIIAAGPATIVSALAVLGGGALAAGGFGVTGGIIVTAGGAALSAALAATISTKMIKDPEIIELQKNLTEIEKLVAKIQLMEEKNLNKNKDLRKKYISLATFVSKELKSKKKINKDTLKKNLFNSRELLDDLENV